MSSTNKITLEPADEDTVQCLFFSPTLGSNILLWEELCQEINNTIKSLSEDYIWQRDDLKVIMPITGCNDSGIPIHLSSTTCFGDNIEDEWFIVYLVLEISRQYGHLIIQIIDNDGDFLLIEAADHLPSWANPETTINRVFIKNKHIHIIPPEVVPLDTKLEIKTAIQIVHETPELTKASNDIQETLLRRVGEYPEKVLDNIHKTVVNLPSKLAALLILKPSLIAPIVDAYCNHDIIDARCCKNIDFTDCVNVNIKFTKFLYATIIHSKLINNVKHCVLENNKKSILGLKLMCGFQMITNKASTDIFSSKEYHKFIENLRQNGYFKSNIKGSKEFNKLLEQAKEHFSIAECPISSQLCNNISELMSSNDYTTIKDSIDKYVVDPGDTGDSEDWLNIHPEQLNELLLSRYGKTSKLKNNDVISSHTVKTELSSFLKQTSDFEGIETEDNEKIDNDNIEFESDKFVLCIEKMLNILSTGENNESEDSDVDNDDMEYDIDDDENDICNEELRDKLQNDSTENLQDSKTILTNILQSMREEKSSTGPTSNLLRTMGIHKTDLLDSDDDID